ncbi:ABC transporter ATP-binding protein/permease [Candidatus Pelagibacter sp.]|nr:ABC transporter ATP-binding protein/permease [Candidatus Pelagibacter sp.]
MQSIKKLFFLLSVDERKNGFFLLLMIIVMALLDMLGIVSVVPFIAVITNPDIIDSNKYLNEFFLFLNQFGVENKNHFLFVLGIFVFLFLIISIIFKAFTNYVQLRFILMRRYTIGKRVLEAYLRQPYSWFLNRNSANLGKSILSEVGTVVGKGLTPLFELISRSLTVVVLVILLLLVDVKITLLVAFIIGGSYGLLFYLTKNYLNRIGKERFKNNTLLFRSITEAFGAVKEVKIGGLEKIYIERFSNPAKAIARKEANAGILAFLPRYFLEAITFGGIILIILYLMVDKGSFNDALPTISLFVFVGYRLLPSLQSIYASFNQLTFVSTAIDSLYADLNSIAKIDTIKDLTKISLNKSISLEQVYYSYPNSSKTALKNININIPAGSTVGFMGSTGSGKTTIIDIIIALLEAQKGSLKVDGKIITKKNSRNWQSSIGYVPQHIYLTDDSVAANIALGTKLYDINYDLVEKASKTANLHEFIINELPNKYHTKVGDRGIRLSGGQRQRIGIARALYHNPSVIILDEATSALDNLTESFVMDAIEKISQNKTIIIIAHRLSTLKKCDKIFLMNKGEIVNQGTYEKIILSNNNFIQN